MYNTDSAVTLFWHNAMVLIVLVDLRKGHERRRQDIARQLSSGRAAGKCFTQVRCLIRRIEGGVCNQLGVVFYDQTFSEMVYFVFVNVAD